MLATLCVGCAPAFAVVAWQTARDDRHECRRVAGPVRAPTQPTLNAGGSLADGESLRAAIRRWNSQQRPEKPALRQCGCRRLIR